ncbi:hypothetical protein VB780_26725 [Leptolyngbya sp. CCNP1308]|uniref:hypothetical protein n=1 Tax=Leptolyngbya sp. CCNP1308 TaxID=3110255 RepID=UPI002B218267|nr:hypothetical protein [Leptolyngbya sp. CCNP1308]MEA5452197.1 hypothetical protein [Leptolyngbya sp. CCNP1308]
MGERSPARSQLDSGEAQTGLRLISPIASPHLDRRLSSAWGLLGVISISTKA